MISIRVAFIPKKLQSFLSQYNRESITIFFLNHTMPSVQGCVTVTVASSPPLQRNSDNSKPFRKRLLLLLAVQMSRGFDNDKVKRKVTTPNFGYHLQNSVDCSLYTQRIPSKNFATFKGILVCFILYSKAHAQMKTTSIFYGLLVPRTGNFSRHFAK